MFSCRLLNTGGGATNRNFLWRWIGSGVQTLKLLQTKICNLLVPFSDLFFRIHTRCFFFCFFFLFCFFTFSPKRFKNFTLWHRTYLYDLYRGASFSPGEKRLGNRQTFSTRLRENLKGFFFKKKQCINFQLYSPKLIIRYRMSTKLLKHSSYTFSFRWQSATRSFPNWSEKLHF